MADADLGRILLYVTMPVSIIRSFLTEFTTAKLHVLAASFVIAQVPLASIFTDRRSYGVAAVRLLVIPALTILLLRLFPVGDHLLSLVILIAASAPVGSNIAIYAQLYHRDYAAAVRQVCLTTILCVLSIPAVIGIAEMIL